MTGGETPPLPGQERAFCQGRGEVPSPTNDEPDDEKWNFFEGDSF